MLKGETTMDEQGSPPSKGLTSDAQNGSTSQETPRTYTETQAQKMVSDALAKAGREHKAELVVLTKERDTFKTELEDVKAAAEENKSERDRIQAELDDMASNDPDRKTYVDRLKALGEEDKKLKGEVRKLEAEKLVYRDRVETAEATNREVAIWEVAAEYEGGDPVKLKSICDRAKVNTREDIEGMADTLWSKSPGPSTGPDPLHVDSGVTHGGGVNYDKLSPTEKIAYGLAHPKNRSTPC